MKTARKVFLIALVALALISLCACDDGKGSTEPGTYTIQYADDLGLHTIDVISGQLYSIDSIPTRNGYEFMGLYDSEQGGTQYVNASGSALTAFTDNHSLVLYPQFRAKQFTLILDYQGADVTGIRSITVDYDSNISNLPTNLTMENKTFSGWFTLPDKKGTQIADRFGVLPQKSKVTENNFNLSDPDGYIYLYAGFTGEMHTVRFYYGNDPTPEEMQIEHGTYISEVITSKRVDGKAAISWTKTNGGSDVFTGKIIADTVLYACEYAPVIDFDANGGRNVDPIIAKAGSSITLPTPTRENYKFAGWYTSGGSKYTSTLMGTESVNLTARWNPLLIFNTNGGMAVDDISAEVGSRVTLPTTTKDGFMFAGWYTEQGQEYTSTSMPQNSVKLVAKYWKVQKTTKVLIPSSNTTSGAVSQCPNLKNNSLELDLSEFFNNGVKDIQITAHYKSRVSSNNGTNANFTYMSWYSQNVASDANLIWRYFEEHTSYNWSTYIQSKNIKLLSPVIYICRHWAITGSSYSYVTQWTDFWVEIEYPDMSRLY